MIWRFPRTDISRAYLKKNSKNKTHFVIGLVGYLSDTCPFGPSVVGPSLFCRSIDPFPHKT